MDANGSYPLVPIPAEHGALVPVTTNLADVDPEPQDWPDPLALLGYFCLQLLGFVFVAMLTIDQLRLQILDLRCRANFWQAQHRRAVQREAKLAEQVEQLKAEKRELERRFYGRKSETSAATNPVATNPAAAGPPVNKPPPRKRGQQRGSTGHGRRNHDHLPVEHEPCVLPPDERTCGCCGLPYVEIPGTNDGDIVEIEVRAHVRRYHRHRYRQACHCPGQPVIITAPPPDKVIAKGGIGISLWVMILQHKFVFFQPLQRILAELRSNDVNLAAGTIIGGLEKLVPLVAPLYQLLADHNRAENHWHCDETRWPVFAKQEDKVGYYWTLWVFAAKQSIVFVLDPTRAHNVPEDHFGQAAQGIASVDRYSAYKAMAQVKAGKILLAFCWAHVRRDFLAVLTSWSELLDWAWSWLEEIAELYQRNDARLSLQENPEAYAKAEQKLREQIAHMAQRRDQELAEPKLRQPQRKVLTSLQNHWSGLTLFVDHPEVPMDNNTAERCHRGPVVGRKNFYGSGSLWSGRLAAMLFSLFQTLALWHLDVGLWLTSYLTACAKAKGKPPPDLQRYLPWNMTEDERKQFSRPQTPPNAKPPPSKTTAPIPA